MASTKELAEELHRIAERNSDKHSAVEEFELWLASYRKQLLAEEFAGSEEPPPSTHKFEVGDLVTYQKHQAIFVVESVDAEKRSAKIRLIMGDYSTPGWDGMAGWALLTPVVFTTNKRH